MRKEGSEWIIFSEIHHSSFIICQFSFNIYHSSFNIHPSSFFINLSFILYHLSFFLHHSSFTLRTTSFYFVESFICFIGIINSTRHDWRSATVVRIRNVSTVLLNGNFVIFKSLWNFILQMASRFSFLYGEAFLIII